METKTLFIALCFLAATVSGCAQGTSKDKTSSTSTEATKKEANYKVTFIELGSTRCIPCQKMQPIMKSIEEKYGTQVKVEFHDVWTPQGQPFGDKYGISAIPTQIFLDANGKEFFRHEGYFPEEELVKVLQGKGVQ